MKENSWNLKVSLEWQATELEKRKKIKKQEAKPQVLFSFFFLQETGIEISSW